MEEHIYRREDLERRLSSIRGKTLEEVDDRGIFDQIRAFDRQKGTVGNIVEQCVLGYEKDSKQKADLIVVEKGGRRVPTEVKSTGMVIPVQKKRFVAKEPMSITGVGIYDLAEQEFETSHFWGKLEHLLMVYYHYTADRPVAPYEYRKFPVKDYEFHTFSPEEVQGLRRDWETVRDLMRDIVGRHPDCRDRDRWRKAVKADYLAEHGALRQKLSWIDLAPRFPPRFRLKKSVVSAMIEAHFDSRRRTGEAGPMSLAELDAWCHALTEQYAGQTAGELADRFGIAQRNKTGKERKQLCALVVAAMFGAKGKKLREQEPFRTFGILPKAVVRNAKGKGTEDMKLFRLDLGELLREYVEDEAGQNRMIRFEDSDLYADFADLQILCALFQEPSKHKGQKAALSEARFEGFKRLTIPDAILEGPVQHLWEDSREKLLHGGLREIRDGRGRSAPNFLKGSENAVFLRGSGEDGRDKHLEFGGIAMYNQWAWLRRDCLLDMLEDLPLL